jgi:PAS domain S-box-containing protein
MIDAFLALDTAWNLLYLNRRAEELLHIRRVNVLGRKVWDVIPTIANSRFHDECQTVVSSRTPARFEAFYPGLGLWIETHLYPSDDGLVVYFNDISEKKRIAHALEESEQRFRAVWESAADAMVLSDAEGKVLAANPAYYSLYGYSPEEVIGQNYAIIFPEEQRQAAIQGYKSVFEGGEIAMTLDSIIRRKDGSERMVESTYRFIMEGDLRVAMLSQIRDVTERRLGHVILEAKLARLAAIMDATTEGIYGMDTSGHCTFINSAALDLLGYTENECLGQDMHQLLHYKHPDGSPYPVTDCPSYQVLHGGGSVRLEDETVWRKDGTAVPVLFSCSPKVDEGEIIGCVITIMDVSERRRVEKERAQLLADEQAARTMAERAIRAQDELLSVVSHDLRNPITVVQGVTQLVQRRLSKGNPPTPEQLAAHLNTISEAVTKMNNFIRDLLSAGSLQPGQLLSISPEELDLVELARKAAASHQQHTRKHTLVVEAHDPEVIGHWDPVRLEQVLDNLLSNAIKYSPDGGQVTIGVGYEKKPVGEATTGKYSDQVDSRQAVLTVQDSGLGIMPEDLNQVFEWYHRGANVADLIGGSGVGLAGARQIVEQHGGSISVDSVLGQGSTFTVTLPIGEAGG